MRDLNINQIREIVRDGFEQRNLSIGDNEVLLFGVSAALFNLHTKGGVFANSFYSDSFFMAAYNGLKDFIPKHLDDYHEMRIDFSFAGREVAREIFESHNKKYEEFVENIRERRRV